jgi:hypothetical protein
MTYTDFLKMIAFAVLPIILFAGALAWICLSLFTKEVAACVAIGSVIIWGYPLLKYLDWITNKI